MASCELEQSLQNGVAWIVISWSSLSGVNATPKISLAAQLALDEGALYSLS